MTDSSETTIAPRLPPVPQSLMTQAQREAVAALLSTPRAGLAGPFVPMLHSPEFLNRAQRLGEYLRFAGALAPKLREFAILIAARHWKQRYEWYVHAPLAARQGLDSAVIEQLARDCRPDRMSREETAIYDFCTQLHRTHGVSDAAYASVHEMIGDVGVIDLCGICGYYSMLAMVMNVARTALPDGASVPF